MESYDFDSFVWVFNEFCFCFIKSYTKKLNWIFGVFFIKISHFRCYGSKFLVYWSSWIIWSSLRIRNFPNDINLCICIILYYILYKHFGGPDPFIYGKFKKKEYQKSQFLSFLSMHSKPINSFWHFITFGIKISLCGYRHNLLAHLAFFKAVNNAHTHTQILSHISVYMYIPRTNMLIKITLVSAVIHDYNTGIYNFAVSLLAKWVVNVRWVESRMYVRMCVCFDMWLIGN